MLYFQRQVDRLLAEKEKQVSFLQEEIKRLEVRLELETKRANNAVDQLLVDKDKYPITPNIEKKEETIETLVQSAVGELALIGEDYSSEE